MNVRTRKVVFALFLAGFLIAAPLVVLYTAGYRYNFGTGQIVQTGVLSVASTPRGATITLDGERVRPSTPALLKNVLPGAHLVGVEKAGYSSWEKRLTIDSRQTTFADDVVLFLDAEPTLARETPIVATTFDPRTGRAAYAQAEGQWTEIWTYDPLTGENTLVSRLPVGADADVELAWAIGDSVLSIQTTVRGERGTSYVNVETGEAVEEVSKGDVLLSTLADRVAVARRSGDANDILAYVPLGDYELRNAPSGIIMIEDVGRRRVVLVRSEGGDQPILLNATASVWDWEPSGSRLLYSDGFDLHVYDAASHTDTTITRLSSAVTGVTWHPGHDIVLYAQHDAIYAIELDHRDRRNVTALMTGSGLGSMRVLRSTLYAFGTIDETSGLFSRLLDR